MIKGSLYNLSNFLWLLQFKLQSKEEGSMSLKGRLHLMSRQLVLFFRTHNDYEPISPIHKPNLQIESYRLLFFHKLFQNRVHLKPNLEGGRTESEILLVEVFKHRRINITKDWKMKRKGLAKAEKRAWWSVQSSSDSCAESDCLQTVWQKAQ